jgi:glycosyltransferase involved in cell wall biosynthesis
MTDRGDTLRVVYVYANPREGLDAAIREGRSPDTSLLGLNHMHEFGVRAERHEPRIRRKPLRVGAVDRVAWYLRELMLPWETDWADVMITPLSNILPMAAAFHGKPKVVVVATGGICGAYERSSSPRRRLIRASLSRAHAVVCLASAQRERLLEQTDIAPERVHVAMLGVDDQFLRPQAPPRDGYVLAVGRDLGRDYKTFAAAVRDLPVRGILVCSPRNLRDVHVPDNVEVRYDVGEMALRDLYAGAACVVVPTRHDSYPYAADCSGQTVLLDAMAMGRPIVVSTRATLTEYIDDGNNAVPVPPEDAGVLRSAVERVLGDTELSSALAARARATVEARHTTRLFARRLVDVVLATCGGPGTTRTSREDRAW